MQLPINLPLILHIIFYQLISRSRYLKCTTFFGRIDFRQCVQSTKLVSLGQVCVLITRNVVAGPRPLARGSSDSDSLPGSTDPIPHRFTCTCRGEATRRPRQPSDGCHLLLECCPSFFAFSN